MKKKMIFLLFAILVIFIVFFNWAFSVNVIGRIFINYNFVYPLAIVVTYFISENKEKVGKIAIITTWIAVFFGIIFFTSVYICYK